MPDWGAIVRDRLRQSGAAEGAGGESADEIAQHLADAYQMHLRRGVPEADALALTEAELSRMESLSEAVRRRERRRRANTHNPSGGRGMRSLVGDLRQALRLFRQRPGYTAIVVATLAIGLGATTAVFSLLNALLLRPLPYPDPDRLVLAWEYAGDPTSPFIVAAPKYRDWKRDTPILRRPRDLGIPHVQSRRGRRAGADRRDPRLIVAVQGARRVARARQGVLPRKKTDPAIAWPSSPTRCGGCTSPAIQVSSGSRFTLNGSSHEVIGVMPPGFEFPGQGNGVWIPIAFTEQDRERGSHSFYVAGRLKPKSRSIRHGPRSDGSARSLAERYEVSREEGAVITRMYEFGLLNVRRILLVLSGAVALVLLIACVNVANLQLGLGLARRREFVLRLALGAGLGRLAQQMLCESLVLAGAGAVGGVALAWVATRAIDLALSPGFRTLPFRGDVPVAIDGRVLLFAAAAAMVSAALFGLWPLISLKRAEPQTLLRHGERGATRLATGVRRLLVTAELALAIIVLCSAGLMIRSLAALLDVRSGVDPTNVLTMRLSLPQVDTFGPPERQAFCRNVIESVEAVAGVTRASASSHLPLMAATRGGGSSSRDGRRPVRVEPGGADFRVVCPGYFRVLGIPLVSGRDFSGSDVRESEQVVIISRATAELFWRGEDPLGRRIKFGGFDSDNPWYTVSASSTACGTSRWTARRARKCIVPTISPPGR